MSRKAYEMAGPSHVKNDVVVGWSELKEAQTKLIGHMAMLAQIFWMGKSWDHQGRMMGNSLSVCPVSLLFKDHKGWKRESGKVPPTRHMAGGHVGMNLHLSEIISDIQEPIENTIKGGEEVISSEDLQVNMIELNKKNKGETKTHDDEEYEVFTDMRIVLLGSGSIFINLPGSSQNRTIIEANYEL